MDMKGQNWSTTALNPVGLIVRKKDLNNLEMPFDQLSDFITPSELFYVRSHLPTPELDPVAFRLRIRGAVRNELSLSYAAIRASLQGNASPHWNAPVTAGYSSRRPCPARNGNSAQSATRNGRAFRCPYCWKAPDWQMACATSFWKAPTAACRRKSPSRRVASPLPTVSRGRGRWKQTFSSLTR